MEKSTEQHIVETDLCAPWNAQLLLRIHKWILAITETKMIAASLMTFIHHISTFQVPYAQENITKASHCGIDARYIYVPAPDFFIVVFYSQRILWPFQKTSSLDYSQQSTLLVRSNTELNHTANIFKVIFTLLNCVQFPL